MTVKGVIGGWDVEGGWGVQGDREGRPYNTVGGWGLGVVNAAGELGYLGVGYVLAAQEFARGEFLAEGLDAEFLGVIFGGARRGEDDAVEVVNGEGDVFAF